MNLPQGPVVADIDTKASVSCISSRLVETFQFQLLVQPKTLRLANDTLIVSPGFISLTFTLDGGNSYTGDFWVIDTSNWDILLGQTVLSKLLFCVVLNGTKLFSGTNMFDARRETPTLQPGQGVKFAGGTTDEQRQIIHLLQEFQDCIFEWSGRYGLFHNYPAKMELTSNVPVRVKPYRLSPDHQQAAQENIGGIHSTWPD